MLYANEALKKKIKEVDYKLYGEISDKKELRASFQIRFKQE
jgi:hypothetical protein